MADKRISQLIERVDIANNDVLPIVASGATTTNKVTISTIQDWMQENLDVGVTSVGITLGSSGTDVNVTGSPITTSGNITINIPTASATNRGLLSSADWTTFNGKQNSITLTTSGTSGAATLVGSTLNIPNYSTGVANAYVPYVGAIGSVTLGYNALSASQINIDGNSPTGGSYLGFKHATSVNTGTDGYTSMYTFGTNTIGFQSTSGGTSKTFSFSMVGITAGVPGGRQYTLPDASGTLALTSDLSGYVTLGTAQTITAQKTFTTSGGDDTLIVNHTSGSGIAVDISKAGNGEGLRVAKTSGTGNAVTITGGLLSAEAATLTGALNGTTASFSGNVTSTGGNFRLFNGYYITAKRADGVDINVLGFPAGSNNLTSVTPNDYNLQNTGGVNLFSISSTGVATFTGNTVAANGSINIEAADPALRFRVTGGSANKRIYEIRAIAAGGSNDRMEIRLWNDAQSSASNLMSITSSGVLMVNNTGSVFHNANTVLAGKLFIPFQSNADIGGTIYTYNDQTFATYEGGIRFQTFKYNGSTFNMEDSMTLNGQGRLGIGTTSPQATLDVAGNIRVGNQLDSTSRYVGKIGTGGTIRNAVGFISSSTEDYVMINTHLSGQTSGECARFTGLGFLKASNNGVYESAAGSYHEINTNASGSSTLVATHRGGSPFGIESHFSGADPNNATNYVFGGYTTSGGFTWIYRIFSNGTVSARSDARWKKNIETARDGYIDDLCKLRVVKYNWYNHEDDAPKELGLIAQEVEEVFPGLVQQDPVIAKREVEQEDGTIIEEEYEDGVSRSVKTSVLPFMLLKAMQEQQEQIKELRAEIEALKSQING